MNWFYDQTEYDFIASSLLIVYDIKSVPCCDIRLIDFAHVRYENSSSSTAGIILGLKSLIKYFEYVASSDADIVKNSKLKIF